MILSNVEILSALDSGRLIVEPSPAPRRPEPERDCPFNTTSLDLRLGPEISRPKEDRPFTIDLAAGSFADLFNPENYETRTISDDQPYNLAPNRFVIGQTLERVELPILDGEPSLAARVEGRSSFARCGLLVHFTAPTIHAGFRGPITLEIINLSPTAVLLRPGIYVCQLIFEEVVGIPFPNDSQFHNQTDPGG